MMRVALMLTPVEFGGAERVCLTLLKYINRQNFDLFLILFTRPWDQNNIFVREVIRSGYKYRLIPVAMRYNEGLWRIARCYKLVYKIFKEENFDVIHTNGYFADIIGIPLARFFGKPCLASCHGFIENTWKYRFYNRLDYYILKYCSQIISVSEGIKEQLLRFGFEKSHIHVIANSVEISDNILSNQILSQEYKNKLGIRRDEFILGYVGRLSKEKGLIYLLNACLQLALQGIFFKLLILGDGLQRTELQSLVQNQNLLDKVIFLGFQEDIRSWLSCIDVFILPSLTEGTPVALLEAMACGVPVIATSVGGIPQVIQNGKTGILISPENSQEIANAVMMLKNNIQIKYKIAENAYNLIKSKFSVDVWIKKIENEYIRLYK